MSKTKPEPAPEPEPDTIINSGNVAAILGDIVAFIGEFFHAHLAPTTPPKFNAATDDPDHPLHHHGKHDSPESPPSEE